MRNKIGLIISFLGLLLSIFGLAMELTTDNINISYSLTIGLLIVGFAWLIIVFLSRMKK